MVHVQVFSKVSGNIGSSGSVMFGPNHLGLTYDKVSNVGNFVSSIYLEAGFVVGLCVGERALLFLERIETEHGDGAGIERPDESTARV